MPVIDPEEPIASGRFRERTEEILRESVDASATKETFTIVMAQGIEKKGKGVIGALTEPYVKALVSVQRLLDIRPEHRIQQGEKNANRHKDHIGSRVD